MTKLKIENIGDTRVTRIGEAKIKDTCLVQHRSGNWFVQFLYEDLLDLLVQDMHKNVAAKYDNVLLATGGEGSGKSSLVYQILSRYKPDWDIETDIANSYTYNMDMLRERFAAGDYGNGMFWMDETTQIASNREWQSDDNKDLVSVLETFRSKKFLFAGCAPKLERVDIYLREFRMRYEVHCQPCRFDNLGYIPRGVFELKKRDDFTGIMKHVGYGLYDPIPEDAAAIYEPLKEMCQERLRLKIAERNKGGKYQDLYKAERKRNQDIMLQLNDMKIIPRDQLMKMFGYENRGTFDNAISIARSKRSALKNEKAE